MNVPRMTEAELAELTEAVLARLARDPRAAHLWRWQPRPGCGDEPPGPARRASLRALLGALAAALPLTDAGCRSCSGRGATAPKRPPADQGPAPPPPSPPAPDAGNPDMPAVDASPAPPEPDKGIVRPRPPKRRRPWRPRPEPPYCADDPCLME